MAGQAAGGAGDPAVRHHRVGDAAAHGAGAQHAQRGSRTGLSAQGHRRGGAGRQSPGGSAVQASLIAARIRELAAKHEVRVLTFIEDIAASGGYWLACAGDEIYADASSIVGSIGVVSAGFGFVEAIRKLGIERRVHTAGANKAILDPFRPERPEDVERLKSLQLDVHEEFRRRWCGTPPRRPARRRRCRSLHRRLLVGPAGDLSSCLVDGLRQSGTQVMRERYGAELVLKIMERSQAAWWRRLNPFGGAPLEAVVEAVETRILMSHFGVYDAGQPAGATKMIVKLLTAAIAIALTLLIVRKLAALAERVRVRVKTERRREERSVTLRQDGSGVWRPEK